MLSCHWTYKVLLITNNCYYQLSLSRACYPLCTEILAVPIMTFSLGYKLLLSPSLTLLLMAHFPISSVPSFLPRCFPASAPFSLTLYVPDGYFLKPKGSKDPRSISGCNGALPWSVFPSWDKHS